MVEYKGKHGYSNEFVNDDGWIIGILPVLFGMRVVVYHKDDDINLPGNLCAGNSPVILGVMYSIIHDWLNTNPNNVIETLNRLHSLETIRPYPNSPKLVKALNELKDLK